MDGAIGRGCSEKTKHVRPVPRILDPLLLVIVVGLACLVMAYQNNEVLEENVVQCEVLEGYDGNWHVATGPAISCYNGAWETNREAMWQVFLVAVPVLAGICTYSCWLEKRRG